MDRLEDSLDILSLDLFGKVWIGLKKKMLSKLTLIVFNKWSGLPNPRSTSQTEDFICCIKDRDKEEEQTDVSQSDQNTQE